jgi:hypothetical protein
MSIPLYNQAVSEQPSGPAVPRHFAATQRAAP